MLCRQKTLTGRNLQHQLNPRMSIENKDMNQLAEIFKSIAKSRRACLRQNTTMLAGFKALGEQDIDYMDSYMDSLWDFMEAGDEMELLYRNYLAYIYSFNPDVWQERMKDLEDSLGYWTPLVIAAAFVARDLHKGQKDKAGNDYFTSHLFAVGDRGWDWKERAVGFLHEAAEETASSEEEIADAVRARLEAMSNVRSSEWAEEFDIMPYPNGSIFFPSSEDWNEITTALRILNRHNSDDKATYIEKVKQNKLALRVRLNDLRCDIDISKASQPTGKDLQRLESDKAEYAELLDALDKMVNEKGNA